MELRRLKVADYDQLIALLNGVFTRHNGCEQDFEKMLPKMCVRDDAHMGKHFGVFEEDRLVACIGVYPLETVVAGEKLLFSTMGNIATHWEHTGKGYMSKLIDVAMQELQDIGADASRLGGNRQRYNRYGFESCGQSLSFTFNKNTLAGRFPTPGEITFVKIAREDITALEFCCDLYNQGQIAVPRKKDNAYLTMTAWEYQPYLCLQSGKRVGYLCADQGGGNLAEVLGVDTQRFTDILCQWQKQHNTPVTFSLQPHQRSLIQQFSSISDTMQLRAPSHFKICNWERVISAFLKLKASYQPLMEGELILQIQDYGIIRIFVNRQGAGCEATRQEPQLNLTPLEASRFLFGPLAPGYTANAGELAESWFPLPLSWNGQDRV